MAEDTGDREVRTNNNWRRLAGLWLPPLAWMTAIFFFSSQANLPRAGAGSLDFAIKKAAHMLEYALLALLLLRACQGSIALLGWQIRRGDRASVFDGPALAAICLAILWAASDEIHQLFVPTRTGTLRDVLIDSAAILLAVLAARWWQRRRERSQYRRS
jgi:VanZ family protein